eukprot:167068_1
MQCYINNELYMNALNIYENNTDLVDSISNVFAIKSCINTNNFEMGKQIIGNMKNNISVEFENCVINFYGHFKDIKAAQNVFNDISNKNTVSINCIMDAFIINKCYYDAVYVYDQYSKLHDDRSHVYAINAYSMIGNIDKVKDIHLKHIKWNENQSIELKNTLIDFYGKHGYIKDSQNLFNDIKDEYKTVVTINCMMNSLCDNKCYDEVLNIYDIWDEIINDISHLLAIKACKNMQNFDKGNEIYNKLKHKNISSELQSSFIDFYASFGDINMALNIFDCIENKNDICLWNAILHCYGRNGDMVNAKNIFDNILNNSDIIPDITTYSTFLNACSHCGQVNMAEFVWENHITDDNIKYDKYVMTAYVDCFSRNGYLEKAYKLVNDYGFVDNNHEMWFSLLSGCRNHDNKLMAKKCLL